MSEVSLSGKLPGGDANGLSGAIVRELINKPEQVQALVVLVDCIQLLTHTDTGETIPRLRIRRVECIAQQDIEEAQRLIRRGFERRCGDTVLPIELEEDINAMFKTFVEDVPHDPEPEQQGTEENPGDETPGTQR